MIIRRPIVFIAIAMIFGVICARAYAPFVFFMGTLPVLAIMVIWAWRDANSRNRNIKAIAIAMLAMVLVYFSAVSAMNYESVLQGTVGVGDSLDIRGARVLGVRTAKSYKEEERRYKLELAMGGAKIVSEGKTIDTNEKILVTISIKKQGDEISQDFLVKRQLVGKKVVLTAVRSELLPATNPNLFDYELYLKTQGVRVVGSGSELGLLPASEQGALSIVYNAICGTKYKFGELVFRSMQVDNAALLFAMLFGDKDSLSEDIYSSFQRSSTTHIICVSGIHMGMVYALVLILCKKRRTLASSLLMFGFLFLYAMISEFTPSIMRALIMIVISILARLILRRYDMLTAIAIAIIILLSANPLYMYHSGAILSFFAVTSLAIVMPFINRFLHYRDKDTGEIIRGRDADKRLKLTVKTRAGGVLLSLALPVFVVQVAMCLVVAYMFSGISIAGLVANIPVVWLAGICVPLGVIIFIVFIIGETISTIIGNGLITDQIQALLGIPLFAQDLLVGFLRSIPERLSALPFSYFRTTAPEARVVICAYGLAFFAISETRRLIFSRQKALRSAIFGVFAIAGIILVLIGSSGEFQHNKAALTFLDVGQGDGLHVRTPDGKNYLFDGGGREDFNVGEQVLYEYFLHNGIGRLDGVFISHLHTDHFKGARELSQVMDVGAVYVYDGNRVIPDECVSGSGFGVQDLRFLKAGDKLELGRDVFVDVLYPYKKTNGEYEEIMGDMDNENANSLVLSLDYRGVKTLMTGDIDEELEKTLIEGVEEMEELVETDILKVAHHGSRFSSCSEFLKAIAPDLAIIQVGRKNMYGHPTADALDRLIASGAKIYRNDRQGAIMVDISKEGRIRVKEMVKYGK